MNPGPFPRSLIALLATFAVVAVGYWFWLSVPRAVVEPGTDEMQCLSYAPFRDPATSPFVADARIPAAAIEADLKALAQRTSCVRTYAVQQGLDAVPEIAQRLGMKVLLGAWIGRDRKANERELERAIELARRYPDVVRALIVGNEVLLRRELPEDVLVSYIRKARAAVPVPVTYADVWEFWLKHPGVAPAVSFATIHILPYWEDEPVGIEEAVEHVVAIHDRMKTELGGKPLLIGETGWPSDGRTRREAVPGRVQQAEFVRHFTRVARERGLSYNLIEAFDQPWKRQLEGAMGGNWGLFDATGEPKFPWQGPVVEEPRWARGPLVALAGALAFAVWAAAAGGGAHRGARILAFALAGAATGAAGALFWRYMEVWNRFAIEWLASGAYLAAAIAFAALATAVAARGPRPLPSAAAAWRALRGEHAGERLRDPLVWLALLQIVLLFGAAALMVLHLFDARYRGFPASLWVIPTGALLLLRLAGVRSGAPEAEERLLSVIVLVGAAAMVVGERLTNHHALGFAVLIGAFALLAGRPFYREVPARASTSAPSRPPTADGS